MNDTRRELRHSVTMQGQYRAGSGVAHDVIVSDLSTTGCKFEDRLSNLRIGSNISIRIGNIGPISGQVKWIDDFTLGVQFLTPIQQYVLDHMLTTIDGWSPPAQQSQAAARPGPAQNTDAVRRYRLNVRPATVADVREALAKASLVLPVASHQDIADLFHHLLAIVSEEDGSDD